MRFVSKTQMNNSLVYAGPSGRNYVSYRNTPFSVDIKDDQEYFLNKTQFVKLGAKDVVKTVLSKAKKSIVSEPEPSEEVGKELKDYLSKIIGLSKKDIAKIVTTYTFLPEFISDVEGGSKPIDLVGEKKAEAIKDFVLSGGVFPVHKGGGWYQLTNGEDVRGREKAHKEQKKLDEVE